MHFGKVSLNFDPNKFTFWFTTFIEKMPKSLHKANFANLLNFSEKFTPTCPPMSLTVPALYVKSVNQDLLTGKACNKIGVRIILDEDPDISGL